jgi:DNA-binding GntR family transcriptional regulator
VIERLAPAITDEQLAELRLHLALEKAAVHDAAVAGRTRLLADFHLILAHMTGNRVLADMLGELLARSSLAALMRQSAHSAGESHAEHVAIVAALERRDAHAVKRLVAQHLEHVRHNLNTTTEIR